MIRAQRVHRNKDYWFEEPIPRGTSISFNAVKPSWESANALKQSPDSIFERAAKFEIEKLDADANRLAPLSGNNDPNAVSTDAYANKLAQLSDNSAPNAVKLGADLSSLATAEGIAERSMNVRPKARPHITLYPVQEWEGYVEKIESDHIVASLVDLTNKGKRVSALADIPFEELDTSDVQRLRIGMIFRWAVGYMRRPGGQKIRGSRIVFRDLPAWTKRDVIEAKAKAAEMARYFANQNDDTP
jgi:hypothetical protein